MRKFQFGLSVFSGTLIIVILVLAFTVPLNFIGNTYKSQEDFLSGWTDESGGEVSLYKAFKNYEKQSFARPVNGEVINGRSLCLITHNINFTVWLDDDKLYDYRPELGGFYGMRYGEELHTVSLPVFTDERELRIEAETLYSDRTGGCNEAWLSDSHFFMRHIQQNSAARLCMCIVLVFFGVMLFIIGIVEDQMCGYMTEAICLGAITLIISAWLGSQTLTVRILCDNPALLRMMEYFALDVLPVPMLLFSASFTKNLDHPLTMVGACLSIFNLIISAILVLTGVCDYSKLLILSHVMIGLGVFLMIYFLIKSVRSKEISRRKSAYLIIATSGLSIAGVFDIIRYYMNGRSSSNSGLLTGVGMFIFSAVLAVYEYQRVIDLQVRSSKTELMQTLAMEDALTKLGSRAAFVAYENEIKERKDGMCLFVHFDVNNLKQANDVYGHAEGDRQLLAAAGVLRSSFGEYGKIFRVGGDEFFAVLDKVSCKEDYAEGIERMKKAVESYNLTEKPPVKLAVAHGMAEYDYAVNNPETAERLADSRMYEEKRRMKEAEANAVS